jgi:hypothetical protein
MAAEGCSGLHCGTPGTKISLTGKEDVEDDAHGPQVHRQPVAARVPAVSDNLWRDVPEGNHRDLVKLKIVCWASSSINPNCCLYVYNPKLAKRALAD